MYRFCLIKLVEKLLVTERQYANLNRASIDKLGCKGMAKKKG